MNRWMFAALLSVLICVASGPPTASVQGAQTAGANGSQSDADGPLTKNRLLKMLLLGDSSPQELVQVVARRGVSFQPTPADEREIHDAGASDDLIVAVRSNFRGPSGNNAPAAQPQASAPSNNLVAQPTAQTGGPAQPEKQKRSFLDRLNAGMDKANAKLNKVNEQVTKQAQATQAATAQATQTVQSLQTQAVQTTQAVKAQASQTAQSTKANARALAPARKSGAQATGGVTAPAPPTQVGSTPATTDGAAAQPAADQNATTQGAAQSASPTGAPPTAVPAPSNLAGTSWDLLSMTKKGEQEKQSGLTPNVQFCRDGTWAILHNGSSEGGKYELQGAHLVMHNGDRSLYGDYQISRNGNEMILDDGTWTLRLRYYDAPKC